ncbi:MAG: hypothetical protein RMH84_00615 [Sulfolobales archaeon]|nr:hypothetical protein [Sulfolobales archaeon]MCX8208091.1 hypothetical protein [Sulfolobales archaeon]MDW8010089.1 hypothetical protein [Sulfolobales archaeon]
MLPLTQSKDALSNIIQNLTEEDIAVLKYFLRYRSVGEILASRELRTIGIKNPSKALAKLISLGLIKRGIGCFTISREVLEAYRRGEIKL